MTRTRPLALVLAALVGAAAAFALDSLLAMRGVAVLVPPASLAVALVLIGVVVLALAWPVRRAAAGERRIDPFYATRAVVLAKASALAGALLAGGAAGILLYLLTRAVVPLGSTLAAGGTVVAAVLLVSAALVAEHWCALPPDDPTEETPA
ncbi:DUF3180 family protein [Microcella humidisoli]|uniref:DUF3180 domain-containing protein n=1 Tax=Microcella humidisoli TaxID=2963406 RepID=A0ABY5FZ14_9MICO|nr:DUF3180 family protein [Microcella humidisoli]UTT63303.1 DUF3180 domain-containing protein [Microcella humidisoli]